MKTIGEKITRLNPVTALTAEFVAGVVVHFFTIAGLPVSTTHAIVGAVGGVGFSRGKKAVDSLLLWEIVLTWILTPFFSGSLAFSFTSSGWFSVLALRRVLLITRV